MMPFKHVVGGLMEIFTKFDSFDFEEGKLIVSGLHLDWKALFKIGKGVTRIPQN